MITDLPLANSMNRECTLITEYLNYYLRNAVNNLFLNSGGYSLMKLIIIVIVKIRDEFQY